MGKVGNFLARIKFYLSPSLTVLLAVFAFIQIYFSLFVIPRSNDECLWIEKNAKSDSTYFYFYKVKENGVTWNAGIRDGDIFLKINGEKIKSLRHASSIIDRIENGDSATYTYSHKGEIFVTKVRMKKLISFGNLATQIYALLWLLVGFIVYRSKPNGIIQSKFFNLGVLLVIWSGLTILTLFTNVENPIMKHRILIAIIGLSGTIAASFIPTAVVGFFWNFPIKFKFTDKKIIKVIHKGLPFVLLAIYVFLRVFMSGNLMLEKGGYNYLPEIYFARIIYFMFFGALIIAFISFTYSYFKTKIKEQRKPLTIILIAYFLGLAGIFYVSTLAQVFADTVFNSPEHYMPIILISLIPISFGYSIFKYSLMDVTEVVKNTVLYASTTILLAGIYFFFIIFLGASIISVLGPEYQGLIIGIVFILFVILFQSTRDKADEFLTKRFFPEKIAFREVLVKFNDEVLGILKMDSIFEKSENIFANRLNISPSGIGLIDKNKLYFPKVNESQLFDGMIEIQRKSFFDWFSSKRKVGDSVAIEKEEFTRIFGKFGQNLIENRIYSAFPFVVKDELLGFLFLGAKQKGGGFSDNEIEILSAVSSQIAIAIKNTRFYESEKENLLLNVDLEKARNIQQHLLPTEMPEIEDFQIFGKMLPARWVGGDYFDIIKISETKFYVVIGDVSGKGFSASFYMSRLQTLVQVLVSQGLSPKDILIQLNKTMSKLMERSYFITISIALFDSEKEIVSFSRGGHTPLKVVENGKLNNFTSKGLALGLARKDEFEKYIEEITIKLEENSLFFFYSDGIEEEMNSKKISIGESFIDNLLIESSEKSVHEIWEDFDAGLSKYRQSAPQHDDITAVIVKFLKK